MYIFVIQVVANEFPSCLTSNCGCWQIIATAKSNKLLKQSLYKLAEVETKKCSKVCPKKKHLNFKNMV